MWNFFAALREVSLRKVLINKIISLLSSSSLLQLTGFYTALFKAPKTLHIEPIINLQQWCLAAAVATAGRGQTDGSVDADLYQTPLWPPANINSHAYEAMWVQRIAQGHIDNNWGVCHC